MSYTIIQRNELPGDGSNYAFQGSRYGDTAISFILVDMAPGSGPRLHKHPYVEIFIVQEGRATYTVGADTIEVQAGQIVVAPPNVPHKFVNSGTGPLKQVDIHLSTRFVTEWLEDEH